MDSFNSVFPNPLSNNENLYEMIFDLRMEKFKLECEIDRLKLFLDMYKKLYEKPIDFRRA